MKILFISEYYHPIIKGGLEINLSSIAQALHERGHNITILTSYFPKFNNKIIQKEEVIEGVNIIRSLKTGENVESIFGNLKRIIFFKRSIINECKKLLKKESYDIIHLTGSSLEVARELENITYSTNTRIVATVESYISLNPKGDFMYSNKIDISRWSLLKHINAILSSEEIGKMKNRVYLRYNPIFWVITYLRFISIERNLKHAHIISISRFVQDIIKKNYNIDSIVVPNFVNVDDFGKVKNKKEINKKRGIPVILFLGSLVKYKGPMWILESLKGLNCRLIFYGEGNLKNKMNDYIKENKINAEIKSPIPYNEVPMIYKESNIVVFPSLWPEPFGRISIEALASSKPVIASNIGGIKETVPKYAGILINPRSKNGMREAVKYLINNLKKGKDMGEMGRNFIKKNYSKDIVMDKLEKVYKRIAK